MCVSLRESSPPNHRIGAPLLDGKCADIWVVTGKTLRCERGVIFMIWYSSIRMIFFELYWSAQGQITTQTCTPHLEHEWVTRCIWLHGLMHAYPLGIKKCEDLSVSEARNCTFNHHLVGGHLKYEDCYIQYLDPAKWSICIFTFLFPFLRLHFLFFSFLFFLFFPFLAPRFGFVNWLRPHA